MSNSSALITVAEARELQQNWIKTRAFELKKARDKEDGREFLFSVNELQEFLDYVKSNSSSADPGVRIYLAAYNDKNKDEATIFLAPTKGTTSGSANDYTLQPLNRVLQGWPPLNY